MIYAFLPIFAAMIYGLSYAFADKALKLVNLSTYMAINMVTAIVILLALMKIKSETLSLSHLPDTKSLIIVLIAATAPSFGWLFTVFAIKQTSATYAAFAEISYPLFALIFLFLFFGLRSVDWTILVGGGLIMIGSFIMIKGQTAK